MTENYTKCLKRKFDKLIYNDRKLTIYAQSKDFDYVCESCGTLLSTPHNCCVMLITECHNSHKKQSEFSLVFAVTELHKMQKINYIA